MARTKKSIETLILESFEGSRHMGGFKSFNDDAYIGYVTAMVVIQNASGAFMLEIFAEVNRLFKEGRLT